MAEVEGCSSSSQRFMFCTSVCPFNPSFRVLGGQGASFMAKQTILGHWEFLKWTESGLKHIILVMLTNTLYYRVFFSVQNISGARLGHLGLFAQ